MKTFRVGDRVTVTTECALPIGTQYRVERNGDVVFDGVVLAVREYHGHSMWYGYDVMIETMSLPVRGYQIRRTA